MIGEERKMVGGRFRDTLCEIHGIPHGIGFIAVTRSDETV